MFIRFLEFTVKPDKKVELFKEDQGGDSTHSEQLQWVF
jgi:hypothetical protein